MSYTITYNDLVNRYGEATAQRIVADMANARKSGSSRNLPMNVAQPNAGGVGNAAANAAANTAKRGLFGNLFKNGGTMKDGFTLPTLNQAFGNANLGYSLGGGYYDQTAKRFLNPDEITFFKNNGNLQKALDSGALKKTDAGLNVGGYQLGKLYTTGLGAVEAIRGLKNADNLNKASQQGSDLKADILATAAGTPNLSSYLTADEQKMLNQLKRGNYYEGDWGSDLGDYAGVLGGAGKGAIAGAIGGGIPGAIVGAIGGGLNGGLSGATKKKETQNAKLDSLYSALTYAKNDYNSMKRPNFSGLGIQQRFRNAYM